VNLTAGIRVTVTVTLIPGPPRYTKGTVRCAARRPDGAKPGFWYSIDWDDHGSGLVHADYLEVTE
jgi:hypothetical protein